jgi:LacI family transcriptional regulator
LLPDTVAPKTTARRAPRVTISDVSTALGLTKGTVSRALNGYPYISDSTRNRVMRAAEKMGYQPLSHAQAIRTGRTRSLGLVLQFSDHDAHRPFLAGFLAGISAAASVANWTLTVATANSEQSTLDTLRRLLHEQKADGFILPRTKIDDPRIHLLRDAGAPFVLFGRTGDPTDCAWFDILGEDAMQDAVGRLAALGHRRIGFVNGGKIYNYSHLRLQGYLRGLTEAGLDADPALIATDAVSTESGARAARGMLRLAEPPTAFVCATDMAALGLYRVAADLDLTIGRDLSVISYDGIPEGAYAVPPLTTFAVDTRLAGERLASLLIRRIRGEQVATLRETAEATLLDRGSFGAPALTTKDLARRLSGRKPE